MKLMDSDLPPLARAKRRPLPLTEESPAANAPARPEPAPAARPASSGVEIALTQSDPNRLSPQVIRDQLAKNLVLARVALGVTQDALAERSGVSRAAIAQIEAGASDCRLNTLTELASAVKISPVLLLLRPVDLNAVAQYLHSAAVQQILSRLTPGDIQTMHRLRETGLQKNLNRVVHTGVAAAEAAGFLSPGATVGAAIGSVIQPGAGTAIGALYGLILGDLSNASRQHTFVAGEGI
jgi:transcriptional regulator with XRE-family HTH domain